ncbi:MAG: PadR family transcriptional regulator [Gemmatimonadota bacterium]
MGRYILGEFEHLVLLTVLQLGEDAYGVSVTERLAEQTGQDVAQAAVYLTLRRLEKKGWLQGHSSRSPGAGDRRTRKTYTVTPDGRTRLAEAQSTLRSMWDAIGEELSS